MIFEDCMNIGQSNSLLVRPPRTDDAAASRSFPVGGIEFELGEGIAIINLGTFQPT
jgi:hypothetical protein